MINNEQMNLVNQIVADISKMIEFKVAQALDKAGHASLDIVERHSSGGSSELHRDLVKLVESLSGGNG